jgi:2'-5' RNA ligase
MGFLPVHIRRLHKASLLTQAVIIILLMSQRYGVVAYVTNPVGKFVEALRRELRPASPRAIAHLTILPPRLLRGSETEALAALQQVCQQNAPFCVELGEVATFLPGTPTVFVGVGQGADRMGALHRMLNAGPLVSAETWPYTPHLTIVRMDTPAEALAVSPGARSRWRGYEGTRRIEVTQLAFVREQEDLTWVDLGHFPLSASLALP